MPSRGGLSRHPIDDGIYRARLPSEITLVQETRFAPDTVCKAMAVLIDEGRVYVVRGLGAFVSPAR